MKRAVRMVSMALAMALMAGPAVAAKKLCPEGQYYFCQGGINGVRCWCRSSSSGGVDVVPIAVLDSTTFDVLSPAADTEVVISANLSPESACELDFAIQLKRFDRTTSEVLSLPGTEGALSAQAGITVVALPPPPGSRQYLRVSGVVEPHDCTISELLSFQTTTASYDRVSDLPIYTRTAWAGFSMEDQSELPPVVPPRPPAVGVGDDEHDEAD